MLQEVTKVACKVISGVLTVAHTSIDFNEYSVSSFFRVGVELGMIDHSDIVGFSSER